MKWKAEGDVLPGEILQRDFAQAWCAGKVYLGARCLYLKRFSGTGYLPYYQILQAWLRQEEVNARMCCATANFDQFYLVMVCADGQERRGQVLSKAAGQRCLDHIAAQKPDVRIGYVKPAE